MSSATDEFESERANLEKVNRKSGCAYVTRIRRPGDSCEDRRDSPSGGAVRDRLAYDRLVWSCPTKI